QRCVVVLQAFLVPVLEHLHRLPDPIFLHRRDVGSQREIHVDEYQKGQVSRVLTCSGLVESAYLGPGVLAKSASLVEQAGAVPALRLDSDPFVSLSRDELWIAPRRVLDEVDLEAAPSEEARGKNFVSGSLKLAHVPKTGKNRTRRFEGMGKLVEIIR